MKKEGYSGTVEMVKVANNFWGWQAVAPETVRADQWQEMADVYVHDKHKLGMKEWFEKENPHAQAQMIERMLEAVRKEYWEAPAETVKELKERYRQLAGKYDVVSENKAFREFVDVGYGMDALAGGACQCRQISKQGLQQQSCQIKLCPCPHGSPADSRYAADQG
jgi:cobaltochelatase CobN